MAFVIKNSGQAVSQHSGASPWRREGRRPARRSGGAVIEMIGILSVMIAFILFTLVALPWLAYQGRLLAAGRTATWLVSHAEDAEKANTTLQSTDFCKKLRAWHFDADGPNAGIVFVDANEVTDGLL